jgi:nicotinamidase-related amidase/isocitrate/isopropylmalate dehydrogenase
MPRERSVRNSSEPALVGLAVGEGTGPELAEVFVEALGAFADEAGVALRVERYPHLFRSFGSSLQTRLSASRVAAESAEDADRYESFVRELAARGARVVFRTAFNAQSLYVVRERLLCLKLEMLPGSGGELLLVRDQAQGFYAGSNDDPAHFPDRISRVTTFSRETTRRVLDFALAAARKRWGRDPDHFVMAYKFHLVDTRLARWVEEFAAERGVDVRIYQPDTMNRGLLRDQWRGNVVIVGANEWGDIMHAEILHRAGHGSQDARCSRNEFLADGLQGIVELQTVHGSADDIAGLGVVNPLATLRAAAQIVEELGAAGFAERVERAIAEVAARGIATPDLGGNASTREVLAAVLGATLVPSDSPASDEALLLIDVQRDFCAADGRFAELGLIEPERMRALARDLDDLAFAARRSRVPVVFVHTHADAPRVPSNVRARHAKTGRAGYLAAGGRGAEPFGVLPAPGDRRVVKGSYDAFLRTDLEALLRGLGVRRVAIAGVFADVCVDACARSAFQLGFEVSVVADGTLALEHGTERALAFMERYYDARVEDAASLAARWSGEHKPAVPR